MPGTVEATQLCTRGLIATVSPEAASRIRDENWDHYQRTDWEVVWGLVGLGCLAAMLEVTLRDY